MEAYERDGGWNHAHGDRTELTYDAQKGVYHAQVETRSERSLALGVVRAVTEATSSDPVAEDSFSAADLDALSTVLGSDSTGYCQVTFSLEGWAVTVGSDGNVRVSEPASGAKD